MLVRAIAAFVALPGVVAFALPLWIGITAGRAARLVLLSIVLLSLGTLLLVWCVSEFLISGRGTLPWHPPERLVTNGPYRVSRNPMYIAVVTILVGWCTLWDSRVLVIYTALFLFGFQLRVLLFEEPWAAQQFGAQWQAYRARVPRWLIGRRAK